MHHDALSYLRDVVKKYNNGILYVLQYIFSASFFFVCNKNLRHFNFQYLLFRLTYDILYLSLHVLLDLLHNYYLHTINYIIQKSWNLNTTIR